jgi:hypothetical protein
MNICDLRFSYSYRQVVTIFWSNIFHRKQVLREREREREKERKRKRERERERERE